MKGEPGTGSRRGICLFSCEVLVLIRFVLGHLATAEAAVGH